MRRRHRSMRKNMIRIKNVLSAYTSVIVAYDQSVREKAKSKPAPNAGAITNSPVFDSWADFVCCPLFFVRFAGMRHETVIINSITTRASIPQASAPHRADDKI